MVVTEGNGKLKRRLVNTLKNLRSQDSIGAENFIPRSRPNNVGRTQVMFVNRGQRSLPHSHGRVNNLNSQNKQRLPRSEQATTSISEVFENLTQSSETSNNRIFQFGVSIPPPTPAVTSAQARVPLVPFSETRVALDDLIHSRGMSVYPSLTRDPDVAMHQYYPSTFRPHKLTFRQACSVIAQFNFSENVNLILNTIAGYTLLIYGIPADCPEEDLWLAVFFFIEEQFHIQAEFEVCTRNLPKEEASVVGVVFKRMSYRLDILKMRGVLGGTRYCVAPNFDLVWVAQSLRANRA